jgi:hypothetical protein
VFSDVGVDRVALQIEVLPEDPEVRNKVAPVGPPGDPDLRDLIWVGRSVPQSLEQLHGELPLDLVIGNVRPVQTNKQQRHLDGEAKFRRHTKSPTITHSKS